MFLEAFTDRYVPRLVTSSKHLITSDMFGGLLRLVQFLQIRIVTVTAAISKNMLF